MIDIILSMFFFVAIIAGTAVSFLLLFFQSQYHKSLYLGFLLVSLVLICLYGFYLSAGTYKNFPVLFAVSKSFIFLIAPCSLFYVRDMLSSGIARSEYDWIHFLPFAMYFAVDLACTGNVSSLKFMAEGGIALKGRFFALMSAIWLAYAFFQTGQILKFNLLTEAENSIVGRKFLSWIRIFNLAILLLFLSLSAYHFLFLADNIIDILGCATAASVLFLIAGGIYFSPNIFRNQNSAEVFAEPKDIKTDLLEFYESVPYTKEECLLELDYTVNFGKFFLRKDVKIKEVAKEAGIAPNIISHLINSQFGFHFNDYISLKRIEYLLENMDKPEWKGLSLQEMAQICGFGSRTSFFRAFQKHKGASPSKYLREIVQKDQDALSV